MHVLDLDGWRPGRLKCNDTPLGSLNTGISETVQSCIYTSETGKLLPILLRELSSKNWPQFVVPDAHIGPSSEDELKCAQDL